MMINHNQESVSGQFIFSASDTSITTVQCPSAVSSLSLSDEAWLWLYLGWPSIRLCCSMLATSPNVGLSLGLSQTQGKVRFMKPSSARQPSAAVRSKPHFSWLDEDCESRVSPSSCFFVLGSIDILIFAQKKINVWPPKSKVLSMTRLPLI